MEKNRSLLTIIDSSIEKISEFSGIIAGLGILTATFVICYEIFIVRLILKTPAIWQTELSIYLLIMATFVGSAYCLKHKGHVSVDLVVIHLPPKVKAWLALFTCVFSLVFCYIIAAKGWVLWHEAHSLGWRSSSLWGPRLTIPYLLVPVGMTLLSLQYLVEISNCIKNILSLRKGYVPGDLQQGRSIH